MNFRKIQALIRREMKEELKYQYPEVLKSEKINRLINYLAVVLTFLYRMAYNSFKFIKKRTSHGN